MVFLERTVLLDDREEETLNYRHRNYALGSATTMGAEPPPGQPWPTDRACQRSFF
jgi:hypothetical protein